MNYQSNHQIMEIVNMTSLHSAWLRTLNMHVMVVRCEGTVACSHEGETLCLQSST